MKPAQDLINEIEDDKIRANVVEAYIAQKKDFFRKYKNVSNLIMSINWNATTQGHQYWGEIYKNL